jgi:hypothetical protein
MAARIIVIMTDPMTVAIATAAAGKVAESLAGGVGESLAAIGRRVREKFQRHPAALATLDAARADPAYIPDLAALLDETMRQDPEFGRQLRALWQQTAAQASENGVVNVVHGDAEKIIQLRDVHGDLNIN